MKGWGQRVAQNDTEGPGPGRGVTVRRFAAVADIATVALGLLGLEILLFRGFRTELPGFAISATNPDRPFIAAVFLAFLRHAVVRRPSLPERLARLVARTWLPTELGAVVRPFVASRLAVLLVGLIAVHAIGFPQAPPWRVSDDEALNLLARYDTGWYLTIAENGYSIGGPGHSDVAFFPLYPLLMAGLGRLLGGRFLAAGFLVSMAAFLGALAYVHRLAGMWCEREGRAGDAVVLLAFYPFAIFFGAVYTESLFLLCAAGAIYHLLRGQTGWSSVFALGAGLVRPNGFLLVLPLGLLALSRAARAAPARRWLLGRRLEVQPTAAGATAWLAVPVLAPLAGVLTYSAYLYWTHGEPFAWADAQAAWGRGYGGVVSIVTGPYAALRREGLLGVIRNWPYDTLNALGGIFALAGLWPVTRRYGLALGVFVAANLLPPLLFGGTVALGRYTSVLFPLFFWAADRISASRCPYWFAAFGMGQGLAACLFFTWRPLF